MGAGGIQACSYPGSSRASRSPNHRVFETQVFSESHPPGLFGKSTHNQSSRRKPKPAEREGWLTLVGLPMTWDHFHEARSTREKPHPRLGQGLVENIVMEKRVLVLGGKGRKEGGDAGE